MEALGSQLAVSVPFTRMRGVGCAPLTQLPYEWCARIGWADGRQDEVWFRHHASGQNRDGFTALDKPWFIKVHGSRIGQNAAEWQAGRDTLSGVGPDWTRMEPTGRRGGGGERELPRVDPGEAWGGWALEPPYGHADFPPATRRTWPIR